jgi:hypothetical protein
VPQRKLTDDESDLYIESIFLLIAGFVLGGVIQFFILTAPIHELGHLLAAHHEGMEARIIGWARIRASGTPTQYYYEAGYRFELGVAVVLSLIVLPWQRRRLSIGRTPHMGWVGVVLGWSVGISFYAAGSSDFAKSSALAGEPVADIMWSTFGPPYLLIAIVAATTLPKLCTRSRYAGISFPPRWQNGIHPDTDADSEGSPPPRDDRSNRSSSPWNDPTRPGGPPVRGGA